jgi:hypothetical protein
MILCITNSPHVLKIVITHHKGDIAAKRKPALVFDALGVASGINASYEHG